MSKITFEIDRGIESQKTITWKSGVPAALVDLTGMRAVMQGRLTPDSEIVLFDLTTENGGITLGGTLGTIRVTFPAAVSALFKWRVATCFIDIFDSANNKIKRFEAEIFVQKSFGV